MTPVLNAPLRTQDILDSRVYEAPMTSVQMQGRFIAQPAKIFVTPVGACPARVRVGQALDREVYPFAVLPIPKGFRVSQWVQLQGCGKLMPLPKQLGFSATP